MTVKELIEKLKQFDENAKVLLSDDVNVYTFAVDVKPSNYLQTDSICIKGDVK